MFYKEKPVFVTINDKLPLILEFSDKKLKLKINFYQQDASFLKPLNIY